MEQYLLLEQARFGDRLQVKLRVDPEVLSVRIPFLCIQPLVENAVRHGLEERDTPGPSASRRWNAARTAGSASRTTGWAMNRGDPAQPVR